MVRAISVTPHVARRSVGCVLGCHSFLPPSPQTMRVQAGLHSVGEKEWSHSHLSLAQAGVPLSNHLLQQQAEGGVPSSQSQPSAETVHRALLLCHLLSLPSEQSLIVCSLQAWPSTLDASLCPIAAPWRALLTDVFKPLCSGGPAWEGEGTGG